MDIWYYLCCVYLTEFLAYTVQFLKNVSNCTKGIMNIADTCFAILTLICFLQFCSSSWHRFMLSLNRHSIAWPQLSTNIWTKTSILHIRVFHVHSLVLSISLNIHVAAFPMLTCCYSQQLLLLWTKTNRGGK